MAEPTTLIAATLFTGGAIWNFAQGILSNFGHTFSEQKVEHYRKWLTQGELPANHHLLKASREAWQRAVHITAAQIAKEDGLTTSWWSSFRQFCRSRFRMRDWSKASRLDLVKPGAEWLAELLNQMGTPAFEAWHLRELFSACSMEDMLAADPASAHATRTAQAFLAWIQEAIELGDYNKPPRLGEHLDGKSECASLWVLHGLELREILKDDEATFRGYMVQTTRRLIAEMKRDQSVTADAAAAVLDEVVTQTPAAFDVDSILTPLGLRLDAVDEWLQKLGGKLDAIHDQTSLLPQMAQDIKDLLRSPGLDLQRYARRVIAEYGPVPVARIDFDAAEGVLELRDVFEEPDVRSFELDEVHLHELPHEAKLGEDGELYSRSDAASVWKERVEKLREKHSSQTPVPVSSVLRSGQHRGHIILGDPGAGKTALLRFLTVSWAMRFLDGAAGREPVPIYIELKQYVEAYTQDRTLSLTDYLHEGTCGMATGMDCARVQELLKSGAAILLLDGLDEIIDETVREQVSRHIRDLFEQGYSILITSRIYRFKSTGWRDATWQGWMLQPFDEAKRTRFMELCHRVFFHSEEERAARLARLQRKLRDFHHMAELASNPLLLTLLCLINRRSGALPENRTQLYESAARLMIYDWEAGHFGEKGPDMGYDLKPLTLDQKHDLLRHIAWRMSVEDDGISTNLITRRVLKEEITRFMRDYPQLGESERYAEQLIAQLRERSFVLCYAGGEYFSFVHRTFLEFYCAWAWTEHPDAESLTEDELWQRLFLARWRQEKWPIIISLVFARLRSDRAERFLRDLPELESPGWPCAGLLLAAECLSETKSRVRHKESGEIIRRRLLAVACSSYTTQGMDYEQDHRNARLRSHAARAFILNSPDPSELGRSLLELARDRGTDAGMRFYAISALGQIMEADGEVRSMLLELARDRGADDYFRIQAISTLGQTFGAEGEVRSILMELARDRGPDAGVRIFAILTLGQIMGADGKVRSCLLELAQDRETYDYLRIPAISALGQTVGADGEVRSFLLELARDRRAGGYIRIHAISTLGQTFGVDGEARSILLEVARDSGANAGLRVRAIRTLGQTVGVDGEVRSILLELARDGRTNAYRHGEDIYALAQIVGAGGEVRSIVMEVARDSGANAGLRVRAIHTLGQTVGVDEDVRSFLLELARDHETGAGLRVRAISALEQTVGVDGEASSILLGLARDRGTDAGVRIKVISVLAQTVGLDGELRSILLELARDRGTDAGVRIRAISKLAQTVRVDGDVRSILLELAQDRGANEKIRGHALGTLCWLLPEDGEIQRVLREFQKSHGLAIS
jgi:hypothetical protein